MTEQSSSEAEDLNDLTETSVSTDVILEKHGPIEQNPLRRSVRATGNITYVPFLYSRDRFIPLRAKHRLLLDAYRPGISLEQAANSAGMTYEAAKSFFRKPIVREWLHDLEKDVSIQNGWAQPGKWWAEGNKVWDGKKVLNKAQLVVWQEFGDRVVPKVSRNASEGSPKIEINIDPGAVQEAFRRQNSIEADIVKESQG